MVSTSTFDQFRSQVSDQFTKVNRRISQVGAMDAAMAQMSFSTQGVNADNRLGVGVSNYRSHQALAVGYARSLSDKATLSFGAAVSGDETTSSVGIGVGW